MRSWIWATAVLVACGGKDGDSGSGGTTVPSTPYMNILSPTPGEFLDEGQEVLLEAEGRTGEGALSPLSEVTWTSDDGVYAVDGNALSVTDLPAGVYALVAEGTVEGQVVSDSVEVVVYAR